MFIGDDMFFGQDRMQFIEMALQWFCWRL